jgi:hypothetical protein
VNKSNSNKDRLARLRPFIRRDLRTRLVSALAALSVLLGLSWLGSSALTRMDTQGAHELRVQLGLERSTEVCGGPASPACTYDDREQAERDRLDRLDRKTRAAVLDELALRVSSQITKLDAIRSPSCGCPRASPVPSLSSPSIVGSPPCATTSARSTPSAPGTVAP